MLRYKQFSRLAAADKVHRTVATNTYSEINKITNNFGKPVKAKSVTYQHMCTLHSIFPDSSLFSCCLLICWSQTCPQPQQSWAESLTYETRNLQTFLICAQNPHAQNYLIYCRYTLLLHIFYCWQFFDYFTIKYKTWVKIIRWLLFGRLCIMPSVWYLILWNWRKWKLAIIHIVWPKKWDYNRQSVILSQEVTRWSQRKAHDAKGGHR